jgi:hypothetical protein
MPEKYQSLSSDSQPKAAATNGSDSHTAGAAAGSGSQASPEALPPEQIEILRNQLIRMYEEVGLPADMVKDLPASGIIEMAQLRGLIQPETDAEEMPQ